MLYRWEGDFVRYLTLQSATHGPGLPKGHAEPGESELETALRETEEETGLVPDVSAWFRRSIRYPVREWQKEVVYLLASCGAEEEVRLSSEHIAFAWMDLDEATAALPFDNLRAVLFDAAVFLKDPILRRGLRRLSVEGARGLLVDRCGADAPVVGHTAEVAGIARTCAEAWGSGVDPSYVEAAAWLHDIGRAVTHGIRHPLEGFLIACAEGFPGYAPPCLSHYVKGRAASELGVSDELVREMWEACDLDRFPVEERLIALADLMAIGDKRGTIEERIADLGERYGPSPFFARGMEIGLGLKDEFEARTGRDLYALVLGKA